MNTSSNLEEFEREAAARESFSGRLLTNRQFDDVKAIVGIIRREIHACGAFKDKLGDYAHAFARSEKFDALRAEGIIRDLFRELTGRTMNQVREDLARNEESISDQHRKQAYHHSYGIAELMEQGAKLSFHRAYAHQAQQFAEETGVTDACAKRLIREEFTKVEGVDFYAWGKELEEQFYRPQIEAERAERAEREQSRSRPDDGARQSARAAFRSRPGPQ